MVVVVNFGAPEAVVPIEGDLELLFTSGDVSLGDGTVVLGSDACAVVQKLSSEELRTTLTG
ncbi:Uncharacterised protein [Mycobacteroides abscessus subsp. abscessus]|nr:Uncharacterised protein [Mycobacteroides abscessus subsp. abscessus]